MLYYLAWRRLSWWDKERDGEAQEEISRYYAARIGEKG